jgi:sulfide:quinone oxidoreductase
MTLAINQLNNDFSYTSQIELDDIVEIVSLGFKTIINNRPDFEGGTEQPNSEALEAIVLSHGISYVHIPVIPNNIEPHQLEKFREAYAKAPKPILGFCKTGNRASTMCKLALENHD